MKTPHYPTSDVVRAKLDAERVKALKKQIGEMMPLVRVRLGEERISALSGQPACIAAGGIDAVLQAACTECGGHPQPVISAAVRVLQMCGSTAKPEDLADAPTA